MLALGARGREFDSPKSPEGVCVVVAMCVCVCVCVCVCLRLCSSVGRACGC